MSIRLLPWFFAAASLGACTSSSAHDGQLAGPVDYKSSGGFDGGGYGTTAHITADGFVSLGPATDSPQLTSDQLAALRTDIDDARFPTLATTYLGNTTEDYIDTVTVEIEGATYTVAASATATIPSGLSRVIEDLRGLSDTPPRRGGA